ncbi:HepT-like ribonuclease domain-containing protein [Schaalia vaccimaxillae]|uniref:HepT-like ribonuclease domain-containing protein n=1 Tax=Schaalia vaccimaxillae TaxID=183916 RepID=UPI0003B36FCD|nr:HepT-like ribonuclease domain-containing protein [Schaalia vaccimaxillae]
MSRKARTEEELIREAIEHLTLAIDHSGHGLEDQMVRDAVAMRILAGIDSLNGLTQARLIGLFGQDWPAMRGMRNRITHGYSSFSPDFITQTVEYELPNVVSILHHALAES